MSLTRRMAFGAALGLVLTTVPIATAGASGGGGCGRPVSNESGTEIEIEGYCFTPTVLYAEPGDTVTWTNLDPYFHDVNGANAGWGSFARLREGRRVSYEFSESGVYSYVCTMHPGMVGTVVVGEPGPGGVTMRKAVRRIKPVSATQPEPLESEGSSGAAALWLTTTGIVAAAGAWLVGRRLRRRVAAS